MLKFASCARSPLICLAQPHMRDQVLSAWLHLDVIGFAPTSKFKYDVASYAPFVRLSRSTLSSSSRLVCLDPLHLQVQDWCIWFRSIYKFKIGVSGYAPSSIQDQCVWLLSIFNFNSLYLQIQVQYGWLYLIFKFKSGAVGSISCPSTSLV